MQNCSFNLGSKIVVTSDTQNGRVCCLRSRCGHDIPYLFGYPSGFLFFFFLSISASDDNLKTIDTNVIEHTKTDRLSKRPATLKKKRTESRERGMIHYVILVVTDGHAKIYMISHFFFQLKLPRCSSAVRIVTNR